MTNTTTTRSRATRLVRLETPDGIAEVGLTARAVERDGSWTFEVCENGDALNPLIEIPVWAPETAIEMARDEHWWAEHTDAFEPIDAPEVS